MALHAVLTLPAFATISHTLKVDGTHALQPPQYAPPLADITGLLITNERMRNAPYLGQEAYIDFSPADRAAPHKAMAYLKEHQPDSYWAKGGRACNNGGNPTLFVIGSAGLPMLSRHGMELIASVWPETNASMEALYRSAGSAEDMAIGLALRGFLDCSILSDQSASTGRMSCFTLSTGQSSVVAW